MLTYHYIRRRGNAPSGWDTRTIWPYPGAQYIAAGNVTFALVFAPDLTYKQRQDAIAHFQKAARIQARQQPRSLFDMVAYRSAAA